MAFITATCALIATIVAFFSGRVSIIYLTMGCIVTFIYIAILVLNAFAFPAWTRFYLSAIVPIWLNIGILLGGGGFGETIAIAASLAITHVVYHHNKRLKFQIMGFTIFCFISVSIYSGLFSPIFGYTNYGYDEVATFLIALGWISVLLKVHEHEKDQLINDLQEKNHQLKETTEQLERFTYIASHDLKSPLRTIVGFLGLMEMDIAKGNYANLQDHMQFAKSGAKQMNYLIQDILELSTLDSTNKEERKWTDLHKILLKVINNLKEDLDSKNASVYLKSLPAYFCNEVEFLLLFQNLIQNGIKYNESEQPKVEIWTSQNEEVLKIHFKDNGIGISEEYYKTIFEFFKRLHTNNKYQGTGIGLGLCKKIVLKYNGQILIDSTLGLGTTFILELPIQHNIEQAAAPAMVSELSSVQ